MRYLILLILFLISCKGADPLDIILNTKSTVVVGRQELRIEELPVVLEDELCKDGKRIIRLSVTHENSDLISLQRLKEQLVPYKTCIEGIEYHRL